MFAEKGIPRGPLTDDVLAELGLDEPQAELDAARTYARRRRIGPWRAEPADADARRKELAKLARRGFSYDVAQRVVMSSED